MPKRKLYEPFNHPEDYTPAATIFGFIIGLVIGGCAIACLVGF